MMRISRRGSVYLAAGFFCFLLFLLVTVPAYWADRLAQRLSRDNVRIQDPAGTLWSGTGTLVVRSLGQEMMRTKIAWAIQPLWLFTGKLGASVTARNSGTPLAASIRLGYRHLSLHAVDAIVPASAVAAFHPAVGLVAPSGRLQISSEQATLTPAGMDGGLQLTWLGAGARMSGLSELGDYRLVVTGQGATADLRVETLRGDVGITAQGSWQTQGEGLLQLSGNIAPGAREQTLLPMLTMLNAQNNNGQYSWTLNQRLPLGQLFGATP
jgi:general secretion pathway protein N